MSEATGSVRVLALDSAQEAKRLSLKGRRGIAEFDVDDIDSIVSALYSLRSGQESVGNERKVFAKSAEPTNIISGRFSAAGLALQQKPKKPPASIEAVEGYPKPKKPRAKRKKLVEKT